MAACQRPPGECKLFCHKQVPVITKLGRPACLPLVTLGKAKLCSALLAQQQTGARGPASPGTRWCKPGTQGFSLLGVYGRWKSH